jgi:alanine racemase
MKQTSSLTWIELSQTALAGNIRSLSALAGDRLLAVCVKANAYGHGLTQVIGMLAKHAEVTYVTVQSIDEAIAARRAGWTKQVLVLGPIQSADLEGVIEYDLEPMICDRQSLSLLGKLSDRHKVQIKTHLKLETGTNRQGVSESELPGFAAVYQKHAGLMKPHGAATHFANIEDTTSHDYAEQQLKCFSRLLKQMAALKIKPRLRHTACSAALILFDKTRFELVRPGIAAYGHWPSKETYLSYRLQGGSNDLFHPVLSWKTRVTQVKQVPADSFVGYGCTYRTTARTRLAVLPIGYADGYDRQLSNLAYVLINGRRAPVRGRVCMNLTMVDITDIKGVRMGDEVTLIGRNGDEVLTAEQLASWAGTINYEILARLSPLIERVIS